MRSFLFALVTLLSACASSPQPQPPSETPPPTATAPDATTPAGATGMPGAPPTDGTQANAGPATSGAPAPADAAVKPEKVAPDVPSGADAARIAELARKVTPLVD
ncbi:hypothetical protein HUA78_45825, partial [Myxococcus sp. CA033]|nr:hypothetical protein [Myxococcus sp. CA033]